MFFIAIYLWFENPRHYEHKQDIGVHLSRTEYQDDLDVNWHEDYQYDTKSSDMSSDDDDDEANSSDDNFIGVIVINMFTINTLEAIAINSPNALPVLNRHQEHR
ncbi:hypothetical protein F5890DRAFT_1478972 [Lentinula detonsa]|uniref:Uncharacterized protein n=1 Tax=Lentinula detonsa TaxID=2804962 RepID=A0AA38PNL6_9AGAR|nr:hypothetical protein F5890DRAFT_1478972 [Lentinula detonsa]